MALEYTVRVIVLEKGGSMHSNFFTVSKQKGFESCFIGGGPVDLIIGLRLSCPLFDFID
jgi:hypothetical protein